MGGQLTFKVKEVLRLVEHAKACNDHQPSYEDLFTPEFHLGGKVKKDEHGWPDPKNIDPSKLPAGLWLVADRGVYLMSNGAPALLVEEGKDANVVAYAKESDPTGGDEFDDWYEAKNLIMGGDDCVITLPVAMFESVLAMLDEGDVLQIKVTTKNIQVHPKPKKH